MTRTQLNRQLARITGESSSTIALLGFSLMREPRRGPEPGNLELVIGCPFCGRPVPYPGPSRPGSDPMAECDRCDVYFGFDPREVHAVDVRRPGRVRRGDRHEA